MPGLVKRALVLAKLEATEGTDAAPTASDTPVFSSQLIVDSPQVTVNGERVDRNLIRQTFSPLGHVIGQRSVTVTFGTELRGPGTAAPTQTSPLAENPLFVMAGLSPTYTASTCTYGFKTSNANPSSGTIYVYTDGLLYKIIGARSNVELQAQVGQIGRFNWTIQGMLGRVLNTSGSEAGDVIVGSDLPASPTFQALTVFPPPVLGATSVSVLGDASQVIDGFNFAANTEVTPRPDITAAGGIKSFMLTGRNPTIRFSPEMVKRFGSAPALDYWGKYLNSAVGAFNATIGSAVGNTIKVASPNLLLANVTPGDRNGIRTLECEAVCVTQTAAGDDEFTVVFT